MSKRSCAVVVLGIACLAGAGSAEEEMPFVGTLGYTSLRTDTLAGLDVHIAIDDRRNVLLPELVGQYGFGFGAVGADVQLMYEDDHGRFHFGGITLHGKARHCIEGPLTFCFGGQLEALVAPWEETGWNDWIGEGLLVNARGGRVAQDCAVVTPHLVVAASSEIVFLQAHAGPDIYIPMGEGDVETFLSFGFVGGVNALSLMSFAVGLRGLALLSFDDFNDTFVNLDLMVLMPLGFVQPHLIVSIPLDVDSFDEHDVILSLGLVAFF